MARASGEGEAIAGIFKLSVMNKDPSPILVANIRSHVLATFVVADEEAQSIALGLALLAEGWGGSSAQDLDWNYRVKKDLGKKFAWRSEEDQKNFNATRELANKSYEYLIRSRKRF